MPHFHSSLVRTLHSYAVEMANLLNLQNAYAANARVATTVKEMLDTLMNI